MHNTTAPKKTGRGWKFTIAAPVRGNLFSIGQQIAQAAMADKRMNRRKIKAKRKERAWQGD